jgi:hypothetical protein
MVIYVNSIRLNIGGQRQIRGNLNQPRKSSQNAEDRDQN